MKINISINIYLLNNKSIVVTELYIFFCWIKIKYKLIIKYTYVILNKINGKKNNKEGKTIKINKFILVVWELNFIYKWILND